MIYWKIGAKGSVLQELCHFVILTADVYHSTDSAYFVKSIVDVHEELIRRKKYF